MYIFSASLLCTILPSQVAFYSIASTSGICSIAIYGLIGLLRAFVTPHEFKWSEIKLGHFSRYFYVAAAFFNAIVFAVEAQ